MELRRWTWLPCSWIGRIYLVKMATLQEIIYRSKAICIKTPMTLLTKLEKLIPRSICMHKRFKNVKNGLLEKEILEISWYSVSNYSNINSMVLSQEQIPKPLEQNQGPRGKLTCCSHLPNLEKLHDLLQNNETRLISYHTQKQTQNTSKTLI